MTSISTAHSTQSFSGTLSRNRPTFLGIPLEVRLQIYEITLHNTHTNNSRYLCISKVCRQIRTEVLPVYFQACRYFRSLSHLSKWTSRGSLYPSLLQQVQSIELMVSKESLSLITIARPTYPVTFNRAKPCTAEWWEAKYAEQFEPPAQPLSFENAAKSKTSEAIRFLRRTGMKESPITSTWTALLRIGELKSIWISLKDQSVPHPFYDIEQQLILNMIAASCPKIQEFTCLSNFLPLECLRCFHDLHLLRFSGYSKSTPEETMDVLRSFRYLDTIIIINCYPESHDRNYDPLIPFTKPPSYLSLTPEVLEKAQPLKRFMISDMAYGLPSELVTTSSLRALKTHKQSLRKLSIHSAMPVDGEFVEEFLSFIAVSYLSNLYIQLIIPKESESLMGSDAVFPKNTRTRERKFSNPRQSAGRWLVNIYVQAA